MFCGRLHHGIIIRTNSTRRALVCTSIHINRNGFNLSDDGLEIARDLSFLDEGNIKLAGFAAFFICTSIHVARGD